MQKYLVTVFDDKVEWRNEAGRLHRLDGPAVEYNDGSGFWYINGESCYKSEFLIRVEEEKTLKSLADKLGYRLEKLPAK